MTQDTLSRTQAPSAEVLDLFTSIVGKDYILTSDDAMEPFMVEWRDRYVGKAACVLCPANTEEVSKIMSTAYEYGVAIVPQGGNTGLVGGQIPDESGDQVVISLSRMNKVLDMSAANNSMTVQAGVILEDAQIIAKEADRLFPLSFGSKKKCQIGGNLATNAGGLAVLTYGNARNLVLGLEVVLADGQIWDGLRGLRKDNSGYSLKDLFIGSEGTLGIITAAVLKLLPRPSQQATALLGLNSLPDIAELYSLSTAIAGQKVTAFEILPKRAMEFLVKHSPDSHNPLHEEHDWYVLLELSSPNSQSRIHELMDTIVSEARQSNYVTDSFVCENEEQSLQLWDMRGSMSQVQKHEGGSIKHDISVPIARIPEFIERANDMVEIMIPGARPVPFGHYGDGNIHYNISQPSSMDKTTFLAQWECINAAIHKIALDLGGSISAEHGIGRMKKDILAETKSPTEMGLMLKIKKALDPKGILNPGKVL